jgi:ribosomal protein S7
MVQKKIYKSELSLENVKLFRVKLIGLINKDGKKNIAIGIVDRVLSSLASRFKTSQSKILLGLFRALDINIEIKKIKIRRAVSIVPFTVSRSRKIFLLVKNILTSVDQDSRRIPFEKKLYEEIANILTGQPCNSIKTLKEIRSLAKQHRSNSHFRW